MGVIRGGRGVGERRAQNVEVQDRGGGIVMEVTGVERGGARGGRLGADGRVKRARGRQALQVDAATADARLVAAGGVIRRVVAPRPPPGPIASA